MTEHMARQRSSVPLSSAQGGRPEVPIVEMVIPSFQLSATVGSANAGWRRDGAWADEANFSFDPPSGYRVVAVDTESCDRVRDLASLRRDLELAKLFAETYVDRALTRPVSGRFADDSLWMSALVAYGRAFGSSVRTTERLNDDWLQEGDRAAHAFLLDLRNKFVAHAVNNFEHSVVIAYLTNSAFERRGISRLGQMHAEVMPLTDEQLAGMIDLCEKHIKHVNRRLRRALSDVSAELKTLGLDEVYAPPDLAPPEIDVARVGKRRK